MIEPRSSLDQSVQRFSPFLLELAQKENYWEGGLVVPNTIVQKGWVSCHPLCTTELDFTNVDSFIEKPAAMGVSAVKVNALLELNNADLFTFDLTPLTSNVTKITDEPKESPTIEELRPLKKDSWIFKLSGKGVTKEKDISRNIHKYKSTLPK